MLPSAASPPIAGPVVLLGAMAATVAVAAEVADADPPLLVAVTTARTVCATSS